MKLRRTVFAATALVLAVGCGNATKGEAGAAGTPGQAGQPGGKGDPGTTGPAGPTGASGTPGAAGAQGAPGPQGPPGNDTGIGPVGPAGPSGGTGPAGPVGPEGPAGTGYLRQVVVGTPVTVETNRSSASLGAFSTDLSITFTPQRTRKFRISLSAPTYINRADASAVLRIAPTAGGPAVVFAQDAYFYNCPTCSSTHTSSPFVIATLTAGTSYTFTAQGSVTGAGVDPNRTVFIFAERVSSGVAMIAEEIE